MYRSSVGRGVFVEDGPREIASGRKRLSEAWSFRLKRPRVSGNVFGKLAADKSGLSEAYVKQAVLMRERLTRGGGLAGRLLGCLSITWFSRDQNCLRRKDCLWLSYPSPTSFGSKTPLISINRVRQTSQTRLVYLVVSMADY